MTHTAAPSGRESSAYTALVLALVAVVIWLFDAVAFLVALVH
jgi:hypothetical protein